MTKKTNRKWSRGLILLGVVAGALVLAGCGLLTKQMAATNQVAPTEEGDVGIDASFSVIVDPTSRTVTAGEDATYTVKLDNKQGVSIDVNLGLGTSNLPPGTSVNFSTTNPVTVPKRSVVTSTLTINAPVGGDYTFTVCAVKVGTSDKTCSGNVTLKVNPPGGCEDNAGPEIKKTLEGTKGASDWYVSDVVVTLEAKDVGCAGLDYIEYNLNDAGWVRYTAPFTISTEGENSLDHRAYDTYGNKGTLDLQYINIDKTPPTLEKDLGGTGKYPYFRTDVEVTLTGDDDTSGLAKVEYNLDGAGWTKYTTPFTITAEGKHTLGHRAYDVAGNKYELPMQEIWIDKTPPTLEKEKDGTAGNNGWWISDVTVTLAADDGNGTGVDYIEYSFNGTTWTKYTGPFTITAEGTTTLYHRAFDKAGNKYELPKQEIKIDKTPPSLKKDLSGTLSNGYYRSAVTVTLTGSDKTSGLDYVEYNLNGAGWVTYTGAFVISTPGVNTLCHRAYDKAGNMYELPCQKIIIAAGCSHGFWKNTSAPWPGGYTRDQLVSSVFPPTTSVTLAPLGSQTLLTALKYTGTSTTKPLDAARILMLQAIAAVLNQAKYEEAYPYSGNVIAAVNAALTRNNGETDAAWRTRMLTLKDTLDRANNSLCQP